MRCFARLLAATTLAFSIAPSLSAQTAAEPATFTLASVQKAAATGDAEAIATIGWFYETGREVAADTRRAASFYRTAMAKGDAFAKWRMGVLIDKGEVAGTSAQAIQYFREAAAQKSAGAMASLGVMHATGRGVEKDYEAAMRYYQAAARMGSAHGVEGIGVLYANGQGVKQDMNEALAHWLAAAAAGDEDATALLMKFMPSSGDAAAQAIYDRAGVIADNFGIGSANTADLAPVAVSGEGQTLGN